MNSRIIIIEYHNGGIKIYKDTPVYGTSILYEGMGHIIPETVARQLSFAKIEIKNKIN